MGLPPRDGQGAWALGGSRAEDTGVAAQEAGLGLALASPPTWQSPSNNRLVPSVRSAVASRKDGEAVGGQGGALRHSLPHSCP